MQIVDSFDFTNTDEHDMSDSGTTTLPDEPAYEEDGRSGDYQIHTIIQQTVDGFIAANGSRRQPKSSGFAGFTAEQ